MKRSIALILVLLGAVLPAAGDGAVDAGPIIVDQSYDDWRDIPSLAIFSRIFEPASFTREQLGEWQVLPLSEARFWKTGGAQLNEIKAVGSGRYLYFFISSQTAFSEGLSIFLYFHLDGDEAGAENRATLEIAPREGSLPGLALLWMREAEGERPLPVGRLISGTFFLEGRIDRHAFDQALGEEIGPDTFVDVTTCRFDSNAGVYEEFFFTSLYLRDIPSRQ